MFYYSITPISSAHLYRVALTFTPATSTELLCMPAWTGGSYLIRDYSGRIRQPEISCGQIQQIAKHKWQLSNLVPSVPITVTWDVFAYSHKIHDAWLDHQRGFINPCALLLLPENDPKEGFALSFNGPYSVHTTLPRLDNGQYFTKDRDELLDSPFTLLAPASDAQSFTVNVKGIAHTFIITGAPQLNIEQIGRDACRIFEETINFWGCAPFTQYLIHLDTGLKLYGGLEHQSSCVLQTDFTELPGKYEDTPPEQYADFLQLLAHEYFHAWLVKFLRPQNFLHYLFDDESYSHDLWVFEGITSYYEQLIPYRCGLISEAKFLKSLSKRFNNVRQKEGFYNESLADASFNAWTHLYKPTADSAYSQTSYYGKGAVLAFLLDAKLRSLSDNHCSLDSVLRAWFTEASQNNTLRGLPDHGFAALVKKYSAVPTIQSFIESLSLACDTSLWEKEWEKTLAYFGLKEKAIDNLSMAQSLLGMFMATRQGEPLKVQYTHSQGVAYQAGLFNGDRLVAINGLCLSAGNVNRLIAQHRGQNVRLTFNRDNQLNECSLCIPTKEVFNCLQLHRDIRVDVSWWKEASED